MNPNSGCVGAILLRVGSEEFGGGTGSMVIHKVDGYFFLNKKYGYFLNIAYDQRNTFSPLFFIKSFKKSESVLLSYVLKKYLGLNE